MNRRAFLRGLTLGTVAAPLAVEAQQAEMPLIGVLHGVSASQWTDRMVGFHRGLADAGFAEGRNVSIEYRWAEGHFDRLPALAADLVSRRVSVISAGAPDVAIRSAMAATNTIPIVFMTASDPVRAGFVSNLGRPEGNVTGVTLIAAELSAKRVELLHVQGARVDTPSGVAPAGRSPHTIGHDFTKSRKVEVMNQARRRQCPNRHGWCALAC